MSHGACLHALFLSWWYEWWWYECGVSLADALEIGPDIGVDARVSLRNRRKHPAIIVAVKVGISLSHLHSPAPCRPTDPVYLHHIAGVSETHWFLLVLVVIAGQRKGGVCGMTHLFELAQEVLWGFAVIFVDHSVIAPEYHGLLIERAL